MHTTSWGIGTHHHEDSMRLGQRVPSRVDTNNTHDKQRKPPTEREWTPLYSLLPLAWPAGIRLHNGNPSAVSGSSAS